MADTPRHLPYEEEARLMTDVVHFFIHKLPHALEMTAQHFDEAALSNAMVEQMEAMSDGQLSEIGVQRDGIPKLAASAAHIFKFANNVPAQQG
jgi:hypothetical protein